MAFDWRDSLRLAHELIEGAPDEARCRAAINRAYYAAYHLTTRAMQRRGLLGRKHLIWETLQDVGHHGGDSTLIAIGRRGADLKQRRFLADYQPSVTLDRAVTPEQASRHAVTMCDEIVALVDRL